MSSELSRREFVEKAGMAAAAGVAGPMVEPISRMVKQVGANDKVIMGLIACGGMGGANMRSLMNHADVEFVAVCDVDSNRIAGDFKAIKDKYGKDPAVYKDYRQMLDRKDIDAVIIGTPDHWHALNYVHACEAGKDSYCEKPLSHNIQEAVAMVRAQKRFNRVTQVGTWQRSTPEFTDAINFIRSGKLGKITGCRAWISDGFKAGKKQVQQPPANLDYDMWTGPAELIPYSPNHVHWNWRWFMNYGGGMSTDWGVHMIDIALLGMSRDQDLVMPYEVMAYGGRWAYPDDYRTAPDTTEALMLFKDPTFTMEWSILRDHPGKPGHCTEFVSADGKTLRVWRGGWVVLDADGKELPKEEGPRVGDHWRNFLDCVKSRQKPRADLASVAQTTIVCHLVNASMYSGKPVRWDKAKWDIVGSAGKETLAYKRPYRKPYKLTMHS